VYVPAGTRSPASMIGADVVNCRRVRTVRTRSRRVEACLTIRGHARAADRSPAKVASRSWRARCPAR
jgi:hypothetical protein